jgi:hypothetical protein
MHGQRTRLLGTLTLLIVAGTLALTACNSSNSASSQRVPGGANNVTSTETPTTAAKAPAKGTLADGLASKVKGLR